MGKKLIRHFKFFLIALLIGVASFSIFKYTVLLREKYELSDNLSRAKEEVAALESEKQNLLVLYQQINQEDTRLKEDLRVSQEKLAKLGADFNSAVKTIEDLNSFLSITEAENTALREENKKIKLELNKTLTAKEALDARFSSFGELKKAIRQLKKRMHAVKVEMIKNIDARESIEGNRGFLIKDGKPTYPPKIKIEVTPLPE